MSYLTENVEGKPFNDFGVDQLSDVSSTTPIDNQGLEYNSSSSEWTGKTFGDGSPGLYFWHQTGDSWRYVGGSTYAYAADSQVSGNPPTELMQANFSNAGSQIGVASDCERYDWGKYSGWYSSSVPRFSGVYVPAGTWYCRAAIAGSPYASTGYAVVRWATGPATGSKPLTADLTAVGPRFYHAIRAGRFAHMPTNIITTTGTSTLLCLEFIAGASFQYGYTNQWLRYYTFHVTKIG
jgi:hypothetical protein